MSSPEAIRRGRMLLLLVGLALLAVADGVWLTLVHIELEVGKPGGVAQVCHKLSREGCAVTGGRFGDVAGIPVATLGMAGAMATVVVGLVAWRRRADETDPWRGAAWGLGVASVLASAVMATFSAIEGSYCPFCVAWYGLNVGIAAAGRAALGPGASRGPAATLRDLTGPPALAIIGVFALSLGVGLWGMKLRRDALLKERAEVLNAWLDEIRAQGRTEIDLTGLPTKGPEDAQITIVEIADFQCPFCRKVWDSVRALDESGASLRTAFIHFPLDGQCNPGLDEVHVHACEAAWAAECARREGKFWEYGQLLFEHQPELGREQLVKIAGELGLDPDTFGTCLDDAAIHAEVTRSIARAAALDVQATPTFYVNGYQIRGSVNPPLFQILIEGLTAPESGATPASPG